MKNPKTMNMHALLEYYENTIRTIHNAVPGTTALEEAVGLRDACRCELIYRLEKCKNKKDVQFMPLVENLLELYQSSVKSIFLNVQDQHKYSIIEVISRIHYIIIEIISGCKKEEYINESELICSKKQEYMSKFIDPDKDNTDSCEEEDDSYKDDLPEPPF